MQVFKRKKVDRFIIRLTGHLLHVSSVLLVSTIKSETKTLSQDIVKFNKKTNTIIPLICGSSYPQPTMVVTDPSPNGWSEGQQ